MAFSLIEWLDTLISFPEDYLFIKYIVLGVVVIVAVSLSYGLIISIFSSIFNRR